MLRNTAALLLRGGLLYAALALLGGWLWLLLRRQAPKAWLPPAPVLGLAVLQVPAWYVSQHLNAGLHQLWPWALAAASMATAILAWLDRQTLQAAVRDRVAWVVPVATAVASIVLFAVSARRLLGRPTLSIASLNNDVAFYASAARHLARTGYDTTGSIPGYDLGERARFDVPGEFNFLDLAAWVNQREVFQVATPALAVCCVLLAQVLASLLRRTTPTPAPLIVLLAVLPQSTFLFSYGLTSYFGSQYQGIVLAATTFGVLVAAFPHPSRGERLAAVALLAATFVGLMMTYPHMLFLFVPVAVAVALLRAGIGRRGRVELLRAAAAGAVLATVLVPERLWMTIDRTVQLGQIDAGWPLPGVLPVALVGFQWSWEGTVQWATVAGSVLLVGGALAAAWHLRRSESWRYPAAAMVVIGLSSYAVLYFGRGGPEYQQWKWVAFLQPFLALALLLPLLGVMLERWPRMATRAAAAALALLLLANVQSSAAHREVVYDGNQWVSAELGLLGDAPALRDVDALNVDLYPYWETMWAAAALAPRTLYLRAPSYYPVSEPVAEWTLVRRTDLPPSVPPSDAVVLGDLYALVRADVLPDRPLVPGS